MIGAALSLWAAPSVSAPLSASDVPLDAAIVVMGEEHDSPQHHLNQADWVRRLAPNAVVFEMLTPELARVAMEMRGADVTDLGEALQWEARGWPSFASYHPIFDALGRAEIVGADVAGDALSVAMSSGAAAALAGDDMFGLATPLDPSERDTREALQASAHCDLLPVDMLPGMVEAQRLRDDALARAALDALDRTGGPVAIITGNGHARTDWGVPALIERTRPDLPVLAIGQVSAAPDDPPYDVWVVSDPPAERAGDDPCDALR